ncbi:DUF4394 domain-containing protein [Hymenobacter metallicola]|uniref:DUF4394 domain-containing protein n=1 Tax=Hymenobacter metallicola TaxID=2563114 RepID=A0A4Z0QGK5_9BACT|nr:DUF4394 domain-containing protein [Hymenobacter metallicola]TGE28171.1 DUF4394 domain-containing protein [Hymenobacter metallicola]
MPIPLLPPLARPEGLRLWWQRAALGALLLGAASPVATAQTVFGLSGTDLTSLDLASPTVRSRKAITGITPGQILVGLDFRPATGQLYTLGYNAATQQAQLYTLNFDSPLAVQTTAATPVGSAQTLALGGTAERIGFDFNPTVDRIRVVSTNDANYRLNPNDGTISATDGAVAYAATDTNAGQNPFIGAAGYTNSFIGSTATTLYTVDEQRSLLLIQNPPNNGTQNTVTTIKTPIPLNTPGVSTDLDIFTNPTTRVQKAYLSINGPDPDPTRAGQFVTALYALNLADGTVTLEGGIGGGSPFDPPVNANPAPGITDIAIRIERTAPAPSGQLLYATTPTGNLISFYSGRPDFLLSSTTITGITAGQTLVGTDFRPNTGELFGLGYNPTTGESRLYIINRSTAVATAVGPGPVLLDLGSSPEALNAVGFDFNPTVDRIRVTGLNTRNYRLNPNNGAVAATDGNLNFVSGATGTPSIGAVAYTNSYAGSTSTTLFDIDDVRNQLFTQSNPNAGQLSGSGAGNLLPSSGAVNDLDFYFDAATQTNQGYLVSNADAATTTASFSTLYTLNTAAGSATAVGVIGLGIPVRDVSATIAPLTQPMLTGRLMYGLAGGNLISFDSGTPNNIRSAVNITGLPADGSQVLVGADFRPLDGQLYALGYNATAQTAQLYTLNLSTGALTAVGSPGSYNLGAASGIGFDFNPSVDRIRVTGSNGTNYRVHPLTGGVTTDLATGRAVSAAAYTNNDNNPATTTTLYGYDQTTNQVVVFSDPNSGTNTPVGSSNITVNPATGVEFDIYSDLSNPSNPTNTAFAAAAPTGTTAESLWEVNLANGSFNQLGRIGSGTNLSGLAAFVAAPAAAGLTWTGAVDTNWGTAGNWSPNRVPTATDDVTIPDTANDPVLLGSQFANNLTLGSGARFTIAANSILSLSGNFTNNGGTTGAGDRGEVYLTNASAQQINGTTTFFNTLTVNAGGLVLNAPVQIQRVLVVSGAVVTNGNLTLLSNPTGTANILQAGNGPVIGTATVQRYIDGAANSGAGYRHYSSPVTGSTVADLTTTGFTPVVNPAYNSAAEPSLVTPFPTVFSYEQSRVPFTGDYVMDFDKGFQSPAALSDGLEVGRGYTVNIPASQTVDFVGTPNSGNITRGGLARNAAPGGTPATQDASGWQLLGNPYPSPIDWDEVGRSNVDGAVYVYRSSGQYEGTYSSYVAGSGVGTNGGTDAIALGQGFFVRVSTPGTSNGQVSFTNAARITDGRTPGFQRTTSPDPSVRLELRGGSGPADEALVYFNAGASPGFDSALDAYKLTAGTAPTLATETTGSLRLSINALPALGSADVTVPLRLQVYQNGTYTLRAAALLNLPTGTFAYLRDAQTGATIDLAQQPSYSFVATAGSQAPRFTLLLTQSKVLASAPAALAQLVSVYPNPASRTVFLSLPASLRTQPVAVTLVNSLGQVVLRDTLQSGRSAADQQLPLTGVRKGVYTLRLTTAEGVVNKRLVVE